LWVWVLKKFLFCSTNFQPNKKKKRKKKFEQDDADQIGKHQENHKVVFSSWQWIKGLFARK